jgi:hypothetical protein
MVGLDGQSQADVVVDQSNMAANGWAFVSTDSSGVAGTGSGSGQFVTGPDTPPSGVGSVNLQTGDGTTGGDGSMQLRNSSWDGTLLSSITTLQYSTYATSDNGSQLPYLTLYLNTDPSTISGYNDRLFFEPVYSNAGAGNGDPFPDQGPVALNQWQTWNTLKGMWYSDNGSPNANEFPGEPNNAGDHAITIQQYEKAFPNAVIVNPSSSLGGIRFASGFSSPTDVYNTYVDAVAIGTAASTVTYDFEPGAAGAVPEPASAMAWAIMGMAVGTTGWLRRRKSAA